MVSHGIGNQSDAAFTGGLSHDSRLADPGRSHKQQRPLADTGDAIGTILSFFGIGFYCMYNFFFRFLDIHTRLLSHVCSFFCERDRFKFN